MSEAAERLGITTAEAYELVFAVSYAPSRAPLDAGSSRSKPSRSTPTTGPSQASRPERRPFTHLPAWSDPGDRCARTPHDQPHIVDGRHVIDGRHAE